MPEGRPKSGVMALPVASAEVMDRIEKSAQDSGNERADSEPPGTPTTIPSNFTLPQQSQPSRRKIFT